VIRREKMMLTGYFGIFEKKKDGYDNYAFKGDPVYNSKGYYADYGQKGYDNVWGASEYRTFDPKTHDVGYDYNDPGFASGSWKK
jgi:hypothetical protein